MEVTLQDLIKILFKQIWLLILCTVICALGTGLVTRYLITPKYESTISFLVVYSSPSSASSSTAYNDLNYSRNVVSNCVEIIDTNDFYTLLSDEIGEEAVTAAALSKAVAFGTSSTTSVINVTVSYSNPDVAYKIASEMGKILGDYITVKYPQPGGNSIGISVINSPLLPTAPSSPNILLNLAVGAFAGLVIGCIIAFLLDRFDVRIRDEKELKQRYNMPILGIIPVFVKKEEGKLETIGK